MSAPGCEDNATDYRIKVVLNKLHAASDRGDSLADELKSYRHGVTSQIFDKVRQDPDFFSFLLKSGLLKPIRFLYYLAIDVRRLSFRGMSTLASARDLDSSKLRGSQAVPTAPPGPRLLIDVTGARTGRVGGGIKRVCDRLASTLSDRGEGQPCAIRDGRLYKADPQSIIEEELFFQTGDTYLIVDSFWDPHEEFVEISKRARGAGAKSVLCIHDAFPISRAKLVPDSFVQLFTRSCLALVPHLDGVISVSQASAAEVQGSLRRLGFEMPVGWFALGCDAFDVRNHWAAGTVPAFLSIGTLEPKKGYDVALDAFEILWAEGVQATYTIVGKEGWLCDALVARIVHHPDFGRRLFWRSNVSDADLSGLVATSFCLIQASLAEGFGLPVAEAAASGLPVIASDLPVFREICAQDAVFFPACDTVALSEAIRRAIEMRPVPPKLNVHSWEAAATALLDSVADVRVKERSI